MADYSNEISKIFNFIGKDIWKMDLDGNGEIIEAECKYYLLKSLENKEIPDLKLENKTAEEDLVFQFWKSINTDRSVKSIASLDSKEIEAMQKRIGLESVLLKYVENLKAPAYEHINDKQWTTYVKEALTKAINEHGGIESFKTEKELDEFIQQHLKSAEYEATVNAVRDAEQNTFLDKYKISNLPDDLQQEIKSFIDDALKNRVDLEGKELADYIGGEVKAIIEAYAKRADASDFNVAKLRAELLENLKKEAPADDKIKTVIEKLGEGGQDALYKALEAFINNYDVKGNYAALKADSSNLLTEFKASDYFKNIETAYRQANAKEVVNGLLVPEEETTMTVFEYVDNRRAENPDYDFFLTRAQAVDFPARNAAQIAKMMYDILGDTKYNKSEIDAYIKEAISNKAGGLDTPDGCRGIVKYILKKYGYDENTKLKGQDSELLTALVKAGVDRELATMILNLSETERSKFPDYASALDKVTKEYAAEDSSIKDKAALIEKLAEEISALVNKGEFKSLQDEIDAKRNVTDKSSEVIASIPKDQLEGKSKFTFYLDKNGEIVFVQYDVATEDKTLFNSDKNEGLQTKFNEARKAAEKTYDSELKALGFSDSDKDNLFNAALYMTLTNTSKVASFYDSMDVKPVIEDFVNNYTALLQKVSKNDKAMEYIKNWDKNSFLAGTTTNLGDSDYRIGSDMQGTKLTDDFGVKDNTTDGDDDWGSINTTEDKYVSFDGLGGNIIHLASGSTRDDSVANDAMDNMVKKYVEKYKDILGGGNKVISLFRQAQEEAIKKLKEVLKEDPDDNKMEGYQVYAYGDWSRGQRRSVDTQKDNKYISVSSLLIQIEVEMERLIGQAVLDM